MLRTRTLATAFALLATAGAAHAQASPYHVISRVRLGGEGGWDYVTADAAAHRLYLSRGSHVMVVSTDNDSVVGDIPGTTGVHGIALAPALGRGFTSNGRDSSVTIFDLKTLAVVGSVHGTGRNPDAIAFDSMSGRVFAFNAGGTTATAIDAATGVIAGTVELGGRPEFAVADGRGRMFANLEDKSAIVAFDTRTLRVAGTYPLAPCEEPSGLAMDRAHRRLFAVCGNKSMAVVDADNGRLVATVPIGDGPDAAAYDPATGDAFSSNGEGTLTVVHEASPSSFAVVQTLPTQRGARTMALDPRTHRIYLVTAEFGPPPAPTAERPRPRPSVVPGSFTLLVIGRD
jgi:DNA-binding beta-propeller fold protein YncE